jgi:aspartate--ammonia ligase
VNFIKKGEQSHGRIRQMGIRVTKDSLKVQLKISGQEDFLKLPYHQAILNDKIPLPIGGGIGQSRTFMYLLRTALLGEVTVSVWPRQLKEICAARNIHVID